MRIESAKVPINGHEIYRELHGPRAGPTMVLLHHGLGSVRAWRTITPGLASGGFRVMAYDRWGYGRSARRPAFDIPSFRTDLDDLGALLDREGIERTVLVGHSDGATIALLWAAACPERVEAVVCVAAHAYVEPKMDEGIEGIRRQWRSDPGFQEALERVHGPRAASVIEGWLEAWHRPENRDWDIRDRLHAVVAPTLVAQGTGDGHATPEHARSIAAALPYSQLWLPEGAGHMLPQERPDAFTARALAFLDEVCPGSPPG